jgi:sugar lactone lactonase YvrE
MFPFNARRRRHLIALGAGLSLSFAHAATPTLERTAFPDSVRAVAQSASAAKQAVVSRSVLKPSESAAMMSFEVALRMRNFDEMQARIARGELISDAEKVAKYYPLAGDHDRVIAWLKAQGLEVTRTDGNRLGIFARGSVDGVARAFQVSFARVVAGDGREFTSAVTAPSLPGDISPVVLGIHGLQPHIRRHPLSTPRALRPDLQINLSGYTPAQLSTAYNATGLGVTGAGQTVAIYSLAYPQSSDLTLFWSEAQVTPKLSNITNVDVAGGPVSPSDPSQEEAALDVEWVSALAPGAAIRVYGADENNPAENDEVLQQVYADIQNHINITIFSISVGGNELDVPKDYLIIEAQYMANLASAGVTVLVASGDTGSTANGILQTTYPTSDPDVTGVGGTTLILNADSTAKTESAWSGSGGGISVAFARPSWQQGVGVPPGNNMRVVPDVASAADPNDGALLVYNGTSTSIGGTSWSAPTWAGFCALMNQKRGTPLGLLNPRIYPLIGTSAFRDILSGSNGNYNAGVGYDLCTGIGVPDVTALLAASLTSTSAATIPAQLGNQFATVGQSATFFVVGEGATPLSYQWQRMPAGSTSWTKLADGGSFAGSGTPMLVESGVTLAANGDQFECIVSNSLGTATSSPASLSVSKVGVTTLAGWPGSNGSANGKGKAARFSYPGSVRTDSAGNIYVADSANYAVRRVTPDGVVTTVAGVPGTIGSTDGPVATALFNAVGGVAIDSAGNLYVADSSDYTIRKVSTAGIVSTLAGVAGIKGDSDGTGSVARFFDPQNLACDAAGNLYVADGMGNVIRRVTPSGVVTTYAGNGASGSADGTGTAAGFNDPTGITVDSQGNVYVADSGNDTVRKIAPGGVVTTVAGTPLAAGSADGTGNAATFNAPDGVSVDSSGNLYVADSKNDTIRKIDPTGFVTTITGSTGTAENIDGTTNIARLDTPGDVTVDSSGVIYVADTLNDTIRRIIPGGDSAPIFTAQPASVTVNLGTSALFSIGISGTAPFTFQWSLNGSPIPGATNPSYAVPEAQLSDAGAYAVTVTNVDGSATSSAATLTVDLPTGFPDITAQPVGGPLATGGSLNLSVGVTGDGPFSYQWLLNGVAIPGATGPTFAASVSGTYSVSITNAVATAVSSSVLVGVENRLINVSTRAIVQTGGAIAIAGFVIHGPAGVPKQVLIRGVGPALAQFSVSGLLASPTITLFGPTNAEISSNTGWGSNADPAQVAAVSAEVGAFALPANSADSAMLAALTPGSYSVELSGVGSTTGVGLVEVYEVNTSDPSLLVNISTRAEVGTGANVLIAGFVVHGTQPATVLVRAVGPTLSSFGVTGILSQPILTVFDSTGAAFASNTGWGSNADTAQIVSVSSQVGAFALPSGSADSALVLTLAPGTYSAEVTGVGGTTGIALVEVYQATP